MSYFTSRNIQALSNETLYRKAPAFFADNAKSTVSENYLFIPTIDIVDGLRSVGWEVVAAKQTMNRSSKPEALMTNKHALFLARTESLQRGANYGDSLPLVKLENSHGGTSAFGLSTGFFRMVCSNGLTVPESIYSAPRVRHTRNMIDEAKQATLTVLRDFPKLIEMKNALGGISLSNDEVMLLGDSAADIFFTREERERINTASRKARNPNAFLLEAQLVTARRYEDRKTDLWTVTNVIQENLIRGNVQLVSETGKVHSQRKVTSIDRDSDIHEKLFMLTQKFADLKGVKIGLTA